MICLIVCLRIVMWDADDSLIQLVLLNFVIVVSLVVFSCSYN
jgi:hypothetical protein